MNKDIDYIYQQALVRFRVSMATDEGMSFQECLEWAIIAVVPLNEQAKENRDD